jgi:hypothetical protein
MIRHLFLDDMYTTKTNSIMQVDSLDKISYQYCKTWDGFSAYEIIPFTAPPRASASIITHMRPI